MPYSPFFDTASFDTASLDAASFDTASLVIAPFDTASLDTALYLTSGAPPLMIGSKGSALVSPLPIRDGMIRR
jgi:hypothetical protein